MHTRRHTRKRARRNACDVREKLHEPDPTYLELRVDPKITLGVGGGRWKVRK